MTYFSTSLLLECIVRFFWFAPLNSFMIKEIDKIVYVGGKNSLSSYMYEDNKLRLIKTKHYDWPVGIMNGSDMGIQFVTNEWPVNFTKCPTSMAFDTCLNWKQEHKDPSVRDVAFDYQHREYHTPSGDWVTMNYTCMNSFIRSVEILDDNTLWVCGTFGTFPRAFSINKTNLSFIKFVDINMMSCARYLDEPMATYRDTNNNLYVASGWGLYRPDKKDPDIPDNNSTMLYADWRLYRNLFTLPSAMAWVLSSDVNFINVVKETKDHLYFFGNEINNQYGLNNQEDRHAWQSFLLRICKSDLGFKYVPTEIGSLMKHLIGVYYSNGAFGNEDYLLSPNHEDLSFNRKWYHDTVHLPTTHFVSAMKINFGCYIGKRPRAISDNHFWGETNIVYINKLADVIFHPNRSIKFKTKNGNKYFGCTDKSHSQLPLIGIFNKPGISGTSMMPTGALCQLQLNENIFNEVGSLKTVYNSHNIMETKTSYQEIMFTSSTSYSNFYSRTMHRTNGVTPYPYWNQGVLIGDNRDRPYYHGAFNDVGKCRDRNFYKHLSLDKFLRIQNFSNTAWPNELPNRLSSIPSTICQYSAVELYSFNASFVVPGVEFKRIFLIEENYTNYFMHRLSNEGEVGQISRRRTSPLMIVAIISTTGQFYRVVLCDFDNAMRNHGEDHTSGQWYNWCIFRHTDQPYLYRQYTPMERREWGESYQYRASSLLLEKTIVDERDKTSYPINRDPQFHVVKDVLRKNNKLHLVTSDNLYNIDITVDCSSYTGCIDCASDPMCMWNIHAGMCIDYNDTKFNIDLFVQDVLDRGFRCAVAIINETVTRFFDESSLIMFNCTNAVFWRGRVVWRINKQDLETDKQLILHSDRTVMTISNYTIDKYGPHVSCYGVKDDEDKLFGGAEYDWSVISSSTLLNHFTARISQPTSTKVRFSWLTFWIVLPFIVALLAGNVWGYLKIKKKLQEIKNLKKLIKKQNCCQFNCVKRQSTPVTVQSYANHLHGCSIENAEIFNFRFETNSAPHTDL